MNLASRTLLISLTLTQSFAFYSGDSEVVELISETWAIVEDSDHAWLVEFFAPWCG